MASEKRERQRANRELKQAEEQKAARKQEYLTRGKRIAIWVVLGVILIIIANLVFGGSNDEAAALVIAALLGIG